MNSKNYIARKAIMHSLILLLTIIIIIVTSDIIIYRDYLKSLENLSISDNLKMFFSGKYNPYAELHHDDLDRRLYIIGKDADVLWIDLLPIESVTLTVDGKTHKLDKSDFYQHEFGNWNYKVFDAYATGWVPTVTKRVYIWSDRKYKDNSLNIKISSKNPSVHVYNKRVFINSNNVTVNYENDVANLIDEKEAK